MSLINQMLQDLEKRQPGVETAGLSAQVAAVPRRRRIAFFWPLILLLTAAAAGLAWQLQQTQAPAETAVALPAKIAPDPQPVETPPPAVIAEAAPPAPPENIPAADVRAEPVPPPPPLPVSVSPPAAAPALKPSTSLALVPRANTGEPARRMPAPVDPADAGKQNPSVAGTVAKQVREVTPQQRADTEYRKALALVQQGRIGEAIDSLALAVQLDASHTSARQTLIGLLVEARRFGEAERRLQEGLNLDRTQPELAMTLARLQVERGDTDAAIATLERSQSSAIDRADYQAFMAALLQRAARHGEAIDHYRQALRRSSSAVWQMGLGISLQAENRFQEAREAFSRAKSANTLSPELQAFVDQRLKQLGQ